jgi:trk system potassium uptake protein TrkA
MKKTIAVIGLGRFGRAVAKELQSKGHDVVGMEQNEDIVNTVVQDIPNALILDATNRQALDAADLASFDIVVVAIGGNQQASILATLLLKEIGVPYVVAKAQNTYHEIILMRVGADRVVQPEKEMGTRLARSLASPNVLDYMSLGQGYSVTELKAPHAMVGKSLEALDMRRKYGVNVLAVKNGQDINAVPKGSDVILADTVLVVAGSDQAVDKLRTM